MSRPFLSRRSWLTVTAAFATRGWTTSPAFAIPTSPPITAVAIAPDRSMIVAGSQAGVGVYSLDGQLLRTIAVTMPQIHDLAFSPDGQTLAVAGGVPAESGLVEMLDWPNGNVRQRIEAHRDVVYQIHFAADGSRWISGSADEVCGVFISGEEVPSQRLRDHSRAVTAAILMPDSRTAVTASRDQTLRVWDTDSGRHLRTLHNHSGDVSALALRPDGAALPMVASAAADLTVRLWQPTLGRMVRFARLPEQPLALAWMDNGSTLVAACRDGQARLIDPNTVQVTQTIPIASGWLYAVTEGPHAMVYGGKDGLVVRPRT